jgi:DNA modification methylase
VIVNRILPGNNIDTLKMIPDGAVDCCVTSPPYYGLRDCGTTAVVAIKNLRKYIGYEINPEYIKFAEQRIACEKGL